MFRIFFLCLVFSNLVAQDRLDTITYSIDLDDFVITAQYEPTHYSQAVHSISLIKEETIEKIGAVTLEQALVMSPSIRMSEDPVLGTRILMRGMAASNVAILIDGVPVIGRNNGSIDLSQISLQNVDKIEVVEGPLSSIYGNNAAGGVINIITKKSQKNPWRIDLTHQVEDLGRRNHMANIGYQERIFNLGLHGRYFEYDQYPADSLRILESEMLADGNSYLTKRYPFNPKTQKSAGGYIRLNVSQEDYFIAKFDYNKEDVTGHGSVKRPQFNPYAQDQFFQTIRQDASLNYVGKMGEDYFINALASFNRYDRQRDDKRYYIDSMQFDPNLQFRDSIRFDQWFGRATLNYTGFSDWTIGGGFNFTQESGSGDRLIHRGEMDSLTTSFTETAFYTDIKYKGIKATQLSLSNRFSIHSTYDNAFTSALQAKIKLSEKITLRSSIAQGYRSPSLKELYLEFIDINHYIIGNPDLQPEMSLDLQSTLEYRQNEDLSFGINAYYTNIDDRIGLFQYETLRFQYYNIDKYSVYGFQPSVNLTMGDLDLSSSLSISYWSTELDDGIGPAHARNLDMNNQLTYDFSRLGINVLVNHRYVGSEPSYRIENEELYVTTVEDYHLIDLSLSKPFWKKRLKLMLGVRNLLDTQTAQITGGASSVHASGGRNSISPGRSLFATLQFSIE